MTENITPEETPKAPDDAANDQPTEAPESNDQPSNEAAKYRRRLRETEAQRDTLTATLEVYRRREVEAAAEVAGLARGADLFDTGVQLADFIGDDGVVDGGKVAEAAAAVLAERPHWRAQQPSMDLGPRGLPANREASWADLLKHGGQAR